MKQLITFFIAAVLVGLLATWHGQQSVQHRSEELIDALQNDLLNTDHRLRVLLDGIQENEVELSSLNDLWQSESIGFVIYDNGQASNWTTNSIPFVTHLSRRSNGPDGVVRLGNAWYLCRTAAVENQLLAAYALIHTDLNFENEHIRNTWGKRFSMLDSHRLTLSELGASPLHFADDSLAIYVRTTSLSTNSNSLLGTVLWFAFILLLLATLWYTANWLGAHTSTTLATVSFVGLLLVFRGFMLWWQLPKALHATDLFGPSLHATSSLIPSLGDFVLHLVFLLLLFLRIGWYHPAKPMAAKWAPWGSVMLPLFLLWPVYLCFQTLVFNSSFSFDLNNPFSLDVYSLIGLLTTFLVLLNFLFLSRYLFGFTSPDKKKFTSVLLPLVVGAGLLFLLFGMKMETLPVIFMGAVLVGALILTEKWTQRLREVSLYTPTVLVFSVFATLLLSSQLILEEKDSRMALARKLALQQNPITEYLFQNLEKKITESRAIRNAIAITPMEQHTALEALREPLNYDHWNQYHSVLNLFDEKGHLLASDEERTGPNYHELQRLYETAKPTITKRFRYVGHWNNDGGYLARVNLKGRRSQLDRILFIRLIPEQTDDILGFTDLFLDEGVSNAKALESYSYARYHNGELQNKLGDYPYGLTDQHYRAQKTEYAFSVEDGFNHLSYHPMDGELVLISRPEIGIIDYLTIFSYLFLFYFACTVVIIVAEGRLFGNLVKGSSFRSRINLAMISVLFVSLLLIGLLTVFYVIREYNGRNQEMISEKSRSVLIEMEHKLRDRESFGPEDQVMLTALLNKFSKVFFTDINLYRLDGHLLATSRPRIFDEGLMAQVMEPTAYNEMRFNQRSSFIHRETIGKLDYLTAYVPFRNEKREVVAFMSLPYFARQHGLQQEIFSLLAALTNIYVFLILISVVMALVISNRITEPLRFIRESLKNLKLDETNRAIEWKSNDEIGELVDEYNRTLNELVQSAELLARSERESAWREMAKQVAHEIKNPLTPMKLSIQMLQRSMADGVPDLNERIEKMSKTLIEQIDTLSNIATEFSSFAQMPKTNIESINLQLLLESAAELHGNTGNEVELDIRADRPSIIQADRDQMQRVLNNLIKNGIQAVPEDRQANIHLGLIEDDNRWVISVQDNGSGIPEDLQDKIFVPNFTTKSSGMGLGLAMVRNIVETVNGKIWFKTAINEGTTFYISLPAMSSND